MSTTLTYTMRGTLVGGLIAAILVPTALVMLLVTLDVWVASVGAPFLALPGNLLVAVLFVVVAVVRSFSPAEARRPNAARHSIERWSWSPCSSAASCWHYRPSRW